MNKYQQLRNIMNYRQVASLLMAIMVAIAQTPLALAVGVTPVSISAPPPPQMPAHVRRAKSNPAAQNQQLRFSDNPSDLEISTARVFSEPLTPMSGRPLPGENRALAQTLLKFKSRGNAEDVSAITDFLRTYPNSRFSPSIELNLGKCRFEAGYLSEALRYWKSAWDLSKAQTGQAQVAVGNGAISQLLVLESRLGRMNEIEEQLPEIAHRRFLGSDESRVTSARRGLAAMKAHPEFSFKCGPYAINNVLNAVTSKKGMDEVLAKAASTTRGTNLWQLKEWSAEVGLDLQPAKRSPDTTVRVPSVMHLKVNHFVAVVAQDHGRYRLKDPTFDTAGERWISQQALESECDGFFLVPSGKLPAGWRAVGEKEAQSVWGKGVTGPANYNDQTISVPHITVGPSCSLTTPMAQASILPEQATQNVFDTPLSYRTPIGPAMKFRIDYNYLETNQPSTFTFSNLGQDWTFNWLSYLTLDSSKNATVRVRGGGTEVYTNTGSTGSPAYADPNLNSQAQLVIVGTNYERLLPDGSIELFNDTDGSGRMFMTCVFDPQGNCASIQYDSNFRIVSITDALGQVSEVSYASNTVGDTGFYNITQISDPFGRTASFSYDSTYSYLLSITDQIGLVSQFQYDTNTDFITTMTTPYGTTSFCQYTPANPGSYLPVGLKVTLPDASSQVVELWVAGANETFYWDREAMAAYPNDPVNSVNPIYSSTWHCAVTEWQEEGTPVTPAPVANWYQPPLAQASTDVETHYSYNGDSPSHYGDHYNVGTTNQPATITQGSSEWQYQYNSFGHVTQAIDPAGRTFSFSYASNNVDLTSVNQTTNGTSGVYETLGQWAYNSSVSGAPSHPVPQHVPLVYVDGNGQRTVFCYNNYGELTQRELPDGSVWTYTYSGNAGNPLPVYLTKIQGPLAGTQDVTTFSYDGYGRVYQATDSEGYTLTFSYDNGDRITQITYPDGTCDQITYDRLDAVLLKDRLGRVTQNAFDSIDQLVSQIDPLGRNTKYAWCTCGGLACLTDPAGHQTGWQHDLEGRTTTKTYPDGSQTTYAYNSNGLMASRTDALSQVADYSYNKDYSLSGINYSNAVNPTSSVNFQYDPFYPRLSGVENANSGLVYNYSPYTTNGNEIQTIMFGGTATNHNVITVTLTSTTATNLAISGTPNAGDVVDVLVVDGQLSGGLHNVKYTVQSTDTSASVLASSLTTAINDDSTLSGEHISATASGSNVLISAYASAGAFSIQPSVNGTITETIGGTINSGDEVSVSVYDPGISQNVSSELPPGVRTYTHTVTTGDTAASIAEALETAINADTTLSSLGITASWTSGNSYFTIASTSVNQTQYSQSVNVTGNETIAQSGGATEAAATAIMANSSYTAAYTVDLYTPTLHGLAQGVGGTIQGDTTMRNAGYDGYWDGDGYGTILTAVPQLGIVSVSATPSGSPSPTETCNTTVAGKVYINADTHTTGDVINVTVMNNAISSGHNVQYTVTSSDSDNSIIGNLETALLDDSTLGSAGIGVTTALNQANSPATAPLQFAAPSSDGPLTLVACANGTVSEAVTYSGTAGDTFSITIYDAGLAGGQVTEEYTATSTDTASTIATALASEISTDGSGIDVSATASSGTVSIKSTSVHKTTFTQSTTGTSSLAQTGGPTEVVTAGGAFGPGNLSSTYNGAIANSLVAYLYDSRGRLTNRSINGEANATGIVYDPISRVTSETNPLGTFGYSYINDASGSSAGDPRLASISYPNGQTTNFAYLPTVLDERLQQIVNLNPSSSVLSQFDYAYDPAGQIRQWQQQQNSTNNHFDLGYDLAGQLTSSQSDSGSSFSAYISGTPNPGDVVSVTAYDASLTGTTPPGQETASYTVSSGDTSSTIATNLASAMNTAFSNISATASASGSIAIISTSPNYCTSFTCAVTGSGATDTIALSQSQAIQPFSKQQYYAYDCAGNRIGVQGDSTGSFPTGLTTTATQADYNCVNELTSTSAGGPIAFQGTTVNPVKSAVVNVTQTVTIGGTITAGDQVYLSVHDPGLSQAEIVSYTVLSTDSASSIASALTSAINADSTLSSLGVSATSSGAVITISSSSVNRTAYTEAVSTGATETVTLGGSLGALAQVSPSQAFSASPTLASGANTASVTAVSGGGTATTNTFPVTISSDTPASFTFDANGNMTSDGTNTYSWDAENRLIQITYPGSANNTQFVYDPLGRRQSIVETASGSVTSNKLLVWGDDILPFEARDGSDDLLAQYFTLGQVNFSGGTGTNEPYTLDHLGSIREMGHMSGSTYVLDSQFGYDPWGNVTQIAGSGATPDFGFAHMLWHQPSSGNFTMFRDYDPASGRWISRDRLAESIGTNLYAYVGNNPISIIDPLGLDWVGSSLNPAMAYAMYLSGVGGQASVPVTDTGWGTQAFDPSIFPPIGAWLPGAYQQAAATGQPVSKAFVCEKRGVTATNNPETYGDFTLNFNGSVSVSPTGAVTVSGNLGGYDIYDFDTEGNSHRSTAGALATDVGLGGGILFNYLHAGLITQPTPYEVDLTPVQIYYSGVYAH